MGLIVEEFAHALDMSVQSALISLGMQERVIHRARPISYSEGISWNWHVSNGVWGQSVIGVFVAFELAGGLWERIISVCLGER